MKRRDFLKNSMSLAALSSLPLKSLAHNSQWLATQLTDDMPIARLSDNQASSLDFNGDSIERPHDILWNIDGHIAKKGGEPTVSEDLDTVVVGGGISGLISAYYLRRQKIVVLEQDTRLGGNSKGELYKNACYSIGAAYICEPTEGSAISAMLQDIDLLDKGRSESGDDATVFFERAVKSPFWEGATAPNAKAEFKKFHQRLSEIYQESDWEFTGSFAKQYDQITAAQWVKNEFGELHPHLMEYLQLYGWSSFCASLDELSAFQYLGFIGAETEAIRAFPGGNAYIAHRLTQRIRRESGESSLRSGAMVLRVQSDGDSVTVLYEDAFGNLKKIRARHVIMACPKFVAKRLLPDIPAAQENVIKYLPYRAYLVGNVLTKKSFTSPSFELFNLKGQMPPTPSPMNKGERNFTDVCFGSWAQQDQTEHSVLTLYHGVPYDGARQFLFNPASHSKYKDKYLTDVEPILAALNMSMSDIHGIRLTRWGHALPVSMKGLIASGAAEAASASIQQRIHFANQDNWMNPCFETAHLVAQEAAAKTF